MYASQKRRESKATKQAYENLANAIIIQAVEDYREALTNNDEYFILSLENFFSSTWYSILTNLPSQVIIEKIRKECCHERKSI